jgi:ketosteroid isomerase-like protein
MTREEAAKLAAELQSAINSHVISAIMNCYAEGAVMVSPVFNTVQGRAAIASTWEAIFSTFPDWKVHVDDLLVDGDRLALLGSNMTIDRKGWFGLPPTGAPINYRAVILLTFAGAKIIRDERVYDLGAVLEHVEKARIDQELKAAAEVQGALLPRTARTGSYYEAVGDSVACRAIGGDFFEFLELPSGDCAVALGDVAGKGPAAALLASMLQGMLTSEARTSSSPSSTLYHLNRSLLDRGLGHQFASLVYGVLSPDGGFLYSNAGHNPPIALSGERVSRLTVGGPILGAFNDAAFEEEMVRLKPQDAVIMFSDGVTEARNKQDEEFGEDRLISSVHALHGLMPADITKSILASVREFCEGTQQSDDVTVAVTRFR